MKALSIRQPWAYAILHLGKRVENREWAGCAYRGPVLLHASKTLVLRHREGTVPTRERGETFGESVEHLLEIVKPSPGIERHSFLKPLASWQVTGGWWRPAPTLPFGGIVGRARIVDVIHVNDQPPDGQWPWYAGGFAMVFADVEPLPFIPWKGSLGFFDVPDDVMLEAIARRACFGAKSC